MFCRLNRIHVRIYILYLIYIPFQASSCCNYGTKGTGNRGYDCVVIPGALKKSNNAQLGFSRICGMGAGLATGFPATMRNMPICCELTKSTVLAMYMFVRLWLTKIGSRTK